MTRKMAQYGQKFGCADISIRTQKRNDPAASGSKWHKLDVSG